MTSNSKETILVTAPGSGIGKKIIENLLKDDYQIITLGREGSKSFAEELILHGYPIHFIECDYLSEKSVKEGFAKAKEISDQITGMIHLVGGSLFSKAIEELEYNEFRKVIEVNLDSAFLIGRETFKWMKEIGGGNIVFFGSTTGFKPSNKKLPYGVAKAGLHAMTWFFAQEGSQYDIVTNTIAPGYVMTDRHIKEIEEKAEKQGVSSEEILKKITSKNPMEQTLNPEQIYPLVKLLLTTKHIQGQIIKIDSGQIMG